MGTGASAAKRKAKKAAAAQYYKVFSELKAANTDYKTSTNNKKQITEVLGDDVSYSAKRLAMKADKTGRAINNDEEYRTDLKRYNSRYEALKKQLSGQSVERYKVGAIPNAEVSENQSRINRTGPIYEQQNNTGIAGTTNDAGLLNKSLAEERYYDTEEEAMNYAKESMAKYNASLDSKLGKKIEQQDNGPSMYGGGGMYGIYSQDYINKQKINDPSKFLKKETLNGITVGYRQLGDMESAYSEIAALSEKAGKSPVNKQAEDYAKLTGQLKHKLRREQGNAGNRPSGLLASELAGNNLIPEVIQA